MDIHDIHGTEVSFQNADEARHFLKHADRDIAVGHFKDAEKHGKTHLDIEGKRFTMIHKEDGYHVRPSNS